MKQDMEQILSVQNLDIALISKKQPKILVNNAQLNLYKGKVHTLVGESGSGKSMTANAIMQILPSNMAYSQRSQIKLQDTELLDLPEVAMRKIRGNKISMVFQEPMSALNPVMTIGKQIMEVFTAHSLKANTVTTVRDKALFKTDKTAARSETLALLKSVGLSRAFFSYYPHQLSGGMRQRVVIAMALAGKPDIIIADEPTTALDAITQKQILDLLVDLTRQHQVALLLITHDLKLIQHYADTVSLMYQGEIVETADAQTFFDNPSHEYGKKLLNIYKSMEQQSVNIGSENVILSVENINKSFIEKTPYGKRKIQVVENASFNIKQGECFALVGGSGSGKTTLAKIIAGLTNANDGQVLMNDISISRLRAKEKAQNIQLIFQDPFNSLNPKLTIYETMKEALQFQKLSKNEKYELITKILDEVGLTQDMLSRFPHEFSGGQRQRIAIARALIVKPKLLICDEPTSALDVSVQAQILTLLKDLQKRYQISILLITHNFSVVSFMAQRVAVMQEGKIVELADISTILQNPQHTYTQKLLEASQL